MPRTPPHVARRLDRLALAAHRFHRFAHHPLCAEYAGEVLKIGKKTRICRGCSAAAAGLLCGVVSALGVRAQLGVLQVCSLACCVACSFVLWFTLRSESEMKRTAPFARSRSPKLVTRFLPAFAASIAVICSLRVYVQQPTNALTAIVSGFSALGALGMLGGYALWYRRRGPQRSPCAACPERQQPRPCRGFIEIVRRERAFIRLSRRFM